MSNPITTDKIYKDTGELDDLIKQLQEVIVLTEKLRNQEVKNAKQLNVEMKKLNVTQSEQREAIEETAKQAEEITRRYNKYNASLNESEKQIAALKVAQQKLNTTNKAQAKLAIALEGSYDQLSAQYTLNKIRLNQMSAAQRNATKEGRKLEKETRKIFEEMKRLQEATGKHVLSVGDYGKALRDLPGPLGRWINDLENVRAGLNSGIKGLKGIVAGMKAWKVALTSLGIGALLLALGGLFDLLTRNQKAIDFVSRTFKGLGAVIDVVLDRAGRFGSAIVKLFKGDFSGAVEDAKGAVSGLGSEIVSEFKEASAVEGELQKIRDESRRLEVQTANTRAEIKRLNLIAEDTTKSTTERSRAAQKAFDIEQELQTQRESLIKREISAIERRNALSKNLVEDEQALADAQKKLGESRQQSLELQTTINNKLNTINQQGAERAKRQREEVRALVQELEDANAVLGGPAAAARLEYDRAIEKIDELRMRARQLGQDLDFSALETLAEAKLSRALSENLLKPLEALPGEAKVPLLEIRSTFEKGFKDAVDVIGEIAPKEFESSASIFERLGLVPSESEKKGIASTFSFIKGQFDSLLQSSVQLAQQRVNLSNRVLQAAENELNRQIQLQTAGLANRAETARQEFEIAKANQEKALKQQEDAQKAQLAFQTIQQTGNLITAASKIWSQLGFPFAIPAIALMFGSFAAAKIKAFQATKQEFAEGGFFETIGGGSHASGNDTFIGTTSKGKRAYAQKDEGHAVYKPGPTRKYRKLLPKLTDWINNGVLEEKISLINKAGSNIPIFVNNNSVNVDTSRMERSLDNIEKQGTRPVRQGNMEIYMNTTTYYV